MYTRPDSDLDGQSSYIQSVQVQLLQERQVRFNTAGSRAWGMSGTLLTQRRARETNHDCSFAHTGGELWQTVATNVRGALRIDCSMCPRLRPTNKTRLVSSGILQTRSVAQLLLLADCHCCQPVHQLDRACACHTWTDPNDVHQQLDRWAGVQYAAARDAGRGGRRIHGLLTDWH